MLTMNEDTSTNVQIVIVEDQPELADIYKTRLQLVGYKCAVANNGIEALVAIEKYKPQLVLLDLMIPKLSGEQVLKVLRSTEWGEDIKVLIISNLNEADAPAGLRDLHIEGYVVKANLSDDQVDQIVGTILKPIGQTENITLDGGQSS